MSRSSKINPSFRISFFVATCDINNDVIRNWKGVYIATGVGRYVGRDKGRIWRGVRYSAYYVVELFRTGWGNVLVRYCTSGRRFKDIFLGWKGEQAYIIYHSRASTHTHTHTQSNLILIFPVEKSMDKINLKIILFYPSFIKELLKQIESLKQLLVSTLSIFTIKKNCILFRQD